MTSRVRGRITSRICEDQRSTHDQCSDDTPEKHSVLIQCWNAKGREDHCNHEDIVQAERFFDHITCKEKNCRGSAVRLALGEVKPESVVLVCKIDEDIESERNTDPSAAQCQCLLKRYRVSLAVEHPEIEGEQRKYKDDKCRP